MQVKLEKAYTCTDVNQDISSSQNNVVGFRNPNVNKMDSVISLMEIKQKYHES